MVENIAQFEYKIYFFIGDRGVGTADWSMMLNSLSSGDVYTAFW